MKIVEQHWNYVRVPDAVELLQIVEEAGRTCWKSEKRNPARDSEITHKFIEDIMSKNHESVLEHGNITVRIVTNRGVTHELVRHRIAAYSQESTRYCNYAKDSFGNEITVILPVWFENLENELRKAQFALWKSGCEAAEKSYFELLAVGQKAQEARDVLPNALKTEIVVTMNFRSWRHFFKLRTSSAAHPQIRRLAQCMLANFKEIVPVVFNNL